MIALKKLAEGVADPDEQRRAIGWIVAIARTHNECWYHDNQRETDFANGMRHVGLQILRLARMSGPELDALRLLHQKKDVHNA